MLKKCLKYDLRSIMRIWWIVAVTMVGASLIAGLGFRFFFESMLNTTEETAGLALLSVFGMMAATLCIFVLVAAVSVSFILVYWRIYTHFFTDEGYLTFTLPAKRSTLYLSKVLTACIVDSASVLLLILGILTAVVIAIPTTDGSLINPVVFDAIGKLLSGLGDLAGGWLILWIPLAIVALLTVELATNGLLFLCITVGAVLAKKHKLIAGIGIYYLVTTVVSFVGQFLMMFAAEGIVVVLAMFTEMGLAGLGISLVLLLAGLVGACMATFLHFFTLNKLETRLNLA